MTNYHLKKRIDIIVESPMTRTVTGLLDAARVPGYSVLPVLEGRGATNSWNSEGQVGNAANMVALMCVVDAAQADAVIKTVIDTIRNRIGFVTVSDVFVVRPERFQSQP